MIARVINNLGTGQVLSLHSDLTDALADTPRDRDGCRAEHTCYWRVPPTTQVGDRVHLEAPNG